MLEQKRYPSKEKKKRDGRARYEESALRSPAKKELKTFSADDWLMAVYA